jgi:hypothetical protein
MPTLVGFKAEGRGETAELLAPAAVALVKLFASFAIEIELPILPF